MTDHFSKFTYQVYNASNHLVGVCVDKGLSKLVINSLGYMTSLLMKDGRTSFDAGYMPAVDPVADFSAL